MVFSIPVPGSNDLTVDYDRRTRVKIECAPGPGLPELRKALGAVASLGVRVGETLLGPWQEPFELEPLLDVNSLPEVSILPDLDDLRLGLEWRGPEGEGREQGLTSEGVKRRLVDFFGRDVEIRIDGGAFGSIRLRSRSAKSETTSTPDVRTVRWASVAVNREGGIGGAWMLRRTATYDQGMFRRMPGNGVSRWTPLAISRVKRAEK
jgi:hypothetical protein